MKSDLKSHGYTIVETMIFLVVTAALFVSALGVFNGAQARTQFIQSLREIDSTIKTTINETESGYYPNTKDFSCSASNGNTLPALTTASVKGQGTNNGCVFLGKTIQFGTNNGSCTGTANNSGCTDYAIHTIVGRQNDGFTKQEVQTLDDPDGNGSGYTGAKPVAGVPILGQPDLAIRGTLPGGLRVYDMYAMRNGSASSIGSVGFLSTLASYSAGASDPLSGAHSVTLVSIDGSNIGDDNSAIYNSARNISEAERNPDQVVICFSYSGTLTTRKGAIVIGGQGHQLTTDIYNDVTAVNAPGGRC